MRKRLRFQHKGGMMSVFKKQLPNDSFRRGIIMPSPGEITRLLQRADQGDADAAEQLFQLVEDDLRAIAAKRCRFFDTAIGVGVSMLVDDVFCQLVGKGNTTWEAGDRKKFFGFAARKMHQLLIDAYRKATSIKDDFRRTVTGYDWDREEDSILSDPDLLIDLSTALERIEAFAPDEAAVFRLRLILGCTFKQAARIMDISPSKTQTLYENALPLLRRELKDYGHDV